MFDRLPPHDTEAEEAVIAAVLVDPDAVAAVQGILQPQDFFREKNGWVYAAAMDVYGRGEDVNQITVAHELAQQHRLEDVGGQTYMADIIRRLPTSLGAQFYAEIVKREATYRALIGAGTAIVEMGYEAPADVDRALARSEDLLLRIGQKRTRPHMTSPESVLMGQSGRGNDGLLGTIQSFLDDPGCITGFRTGWEWFDLACDGYQPAQVYGVLADTSIGKSLWVHWTASLFAKAGERPALFSTEMSAREVVQRLVYMQAGVDPYALRLRGSATTGEKQRVNAAALEVAEWPIAICDLGGITWPQVLAELRRLERGGFGMVALDHIQQITVPGLSAEDPAGITEIMNGAKAVSMNYDVPVIAVSHVNRASVTGQGKPHGLGMHSGRGSKSIEDASDVLITLQPVVWKFETRTWELATEQEADAERAHDRLDVMVKLNKHRHGGRPWAVRHLSWGQGGRFVATPRGVQG